MEKLLDLVHKLRESVVPAAKLAKMSKKELVSFIEDAKILDKMNIFHEKRKSKATLKSLVHDADEEGVVPDLASVRKMSVSKVRKLLREFHRDIGLKAKHSKMTPSKLRSFVARNKYQEMVFGDDDMAFLTQGEDRKTKTKRQRTWFYRS